MEHQSEDEEVEDDPQRDWNTVVNEEVGYIQSSRRSGENMPIHMRDDQGVWKQLSSFENRDFQEKQEVWYFALLLLNRKCLIGERGFVCEVEDNTLRLARNHEFCSH